MTGAAKGTVIRLLNNVGAACSAYQNNVMNNLNCKKVQCDEIWSFCYSKQKNVPESKRDEYGVGDVWTWVAIDADTRLVPCWVVGDRSAEFAHAFMYDLKSRLTNRIQLTTDGYKTYLEAVEDAFGADIDYAMLVKLYGKTYHQDTRYSPPPCIGTDTRVKQGKPDTTQISTSYVERQNLTMRMHMRRFTRLTNAFSKKIANLEHAVALHFMYYNFCKVHIGLKTTPAIAAGVSEQKWEISDIVNLIN
jgi:IS1 family transposase